MSATKDIVVGIDPGLYGAFAFLVLNKNNELAIADMPIIISDNKKVIHIHSVVDTLKMEAHRILHVIIERVSSMPGDGHVGAFSFGRNYGILLGAVAALGLPYTTVPPQVWKKKLDVPANKDLARARASELFPAYSNIWPLKKHDGRAEAALIALYGKRIFTNE